ncbi:phosphoribosylformylglycinamidine synthase [Halosquirtibacter xylanolyticus]|uniref:phosphoribosylformylglycinamidine synthase n=1 Tax=Halosquirtibacter xylanolyticus TaxID=3374599 RepID=UPI00374A3CED|nr:phosphoribosylformylglycinamidine synthase [Prolixibacteraceae bacterium]
MILFFEGSQSILAVDSFQQLTSDTIEKLTWLFGDAQLLKEATMKGTFIGPRKEMITPWSTNAVEITQNMGINGIRRVEEFFQVENSDPTFDPMLQRKYTQLDQQLFTIDKTPDPIQYIEDIEAYNEKEGLALSSEEIEYLRGLSKEIERPLTDSEVYGFAQVNSEHCRHKIFNGTFIIDGEEKPSTLFQLIKKTSKEHPNTIVSAYKDNCSFTEGSQVEQFAPITHDGPDYYQIRDIDTVLSLKAETHNFPTTVEPFNGAATGTGGEIRDRIAGGKGSLPIAGTAVYMTSYPRNSEGKRWEEDKAPRPWLYQTPEEILIKASNGASDFGNKFGQPLINGSLMTFEHFEQDQKFGYDKVIMLAGGIGLANKKDALKDTPNKGDAVVLIGGDNYRIGMGGGAVSSVDTGNFSSSIELNAVQRANPEMQKRTYNTIRALAEEENNPISTVHDHGAGGHLNCLSELVEETGGRIDMDNLPVGDPTLSLKEICGNESQERIGFVTSKENLEKIERIAKRERTPLYEIGETTGDDRFVFESKKAGKAPIDLALKHFFGSSPKTVLTDKTSQRKFAPVTYDNKEITSYIEEVLSLESVACKDWLTNKVDRSVTGKIAKQQCAGEIQLPLNNLGAIAQDFQGERGIATSLGHASSAALIDAAKGSILSIAESLTNLVWAPMTHGIKGVSLSANWMWPAKNRGENARLYEAVEAASEFACGLGINIPTGKDSLSMTQKYKDDVVYAPGTVIISASGEVKDVKKIVEPVVVNDECKAIYYVDFSNSELALGGSAFAQINSKLGVDVPTVSDASFFAKQFESLQQLILEGLVAAGHDVGSGGLITSLLELCFANTKGGLNLSLDGISDKDWAHILFSENPAAVVQANDTNVFETRAKALGLKYTSLGSPSKERMLTLSHKEEQLTLDIDYLRDVWYRPSYELDKMQSGETLATARFGNYAEQPLAFDFKTFNASLSKLGITPSRRERSGLKAAIIREKGVNGEREMAWSLHLAGFDVKDVHMTDLISGRETLEDIHFIVFCGGFSNSDVLGSAKGWAGAFKYNPKAQQALQRFYARQNTMSLGVCNGCQLMVALDLISSNDVNLDVKMEHNDSHKFESNFVGVTIPSDTDSIMLKSLQGMSLGVWIAHGEGKFVFSSKEQPSGIAMKYNYHAYPANPNGSDFDTAAIVSKDGRHLAMMPHLERSVYPWQWGHFPSDRNNDTITPWLEAFVNARQWIQKQI